MIDLLTVVFRDEIPILKVQAQSVELYCQDLNIRTIYVIVNDDDNIVKLINKEWWGKLAPCVKLIPRSIFSIGWLHPSGWITQQIFKILGSSLSYSNWTLVLDTKTIIIKPLSYQNLITSTTISKQSTCPILPIWQDSKFHQSVNELFGINLDCAISPNGVPFLFHNNTIRSMIGDITKKTNENFSDWFQQQYNPSEFLLYAGYLKYLHGSVGKMFDLSPYDYKVNNICHSDTLDHKTALANIIADDNLLSVSIHRNVWSKLTADQKQTYINLLLSKNIITASELV